MIADPTPTTTETQQPTAAVSIASLRVLRLCAAHMAAGVRPWAGMKGEDSARARLAELEEAQREAEAAIRAAGHPVNPGA